jgi:hypothetical protein
MAQQHLEQVPLGRGQPDVGVLLGRRPVARLAAGPRVPHHPLGRKVDDEIA